MPRLLSLPRSKGRSRWTPWIALAIGGVLVAAFREPGPRMGAAVAATPSTAIATAPAPDRSPVDLALSDDERWLITANQTSNSVSLIDLAAGRVITEVPCGEHPTAVAWVPGGNRLLVSCMYAGTVEAYEVGPNPPHPQPLSHKGRGESADRHSGTADWLLRKVGSVDVGMHPYGLAVTADGRTAYVSLSAAPKVAEIDLGAMQIAGTIDVGRWPREMALSPDGKKLAVSTSGDQTVSIVDLTRHQLAFQHRTGGGLNIGQLQIDRAGTQVYFPWIVYRQFAVTPGNIRLGWVLATRIARAKLDANSYREAISLDVPGLAMGDPHGLALTPDEQWMACTASGTHELLVYRLADQKFMSVGGPGDVADPAVVRNPKKFYRVPLGGRPMNVRAARDNRRVLVANYLLNCVQTVDLDRREVVATIDLGGPAEPSPARRGQEIFLDARHSLDQWYSCHSCHYDAGPNATVMDTRNDGSDRTFKTVPALYNVTHTGPWTWHGWQQDLGAAMRKSITETMLGPPPTADEVKALLAYCSELRPPPNPFAAKAGKDAATKATVGRGREVFRSEKAGCANCHKGAYFTDGEIHDVGLGSQKDVYQGFNTPSLVGVYQRVRLLHDGRAKSLEEALTGDHDPAKVTGRGSLTPLELTDLIEYLKTL